MTPRLKIVLSIGAAALALMLGLSTWLSEHDDRTRLEATLKAQSETISKLDAQMSHRDQQTAQLVEQIQKMAAKVRTPTQAVQALPNVVNLPKPIYIDVPKDKEGKPLPDAPSSVVIPKESVVPLFQELAKCKQQSTELDGCKATVADLKTKSTTLQSERDQAVAVVRGGTFWTRVKRNAEWLAIGAAVGAVAARR